MKGVPAVAGESLVVSGCGAGVKGVDARTGVWDSPLGPARA